MSMHQNLNISVKVKPADLVAALTKNKQKHLEDYAKAVTVYHEDLTKRLRHLLKKAARKDLSDSFTLSMAKPVNNEKLYDKYIGMFSMATNPEIEVSSHDYGCIVDDSWDWAVQASTMNAMYSSKFIQK